MQLLCCSLASTTGLCSCCAAAWLGRWPGLQQLTSRSDRRACPCSPSSCRCWRTCPRARRACTSCPGPSAAPSSVRRLLAGQGQASLSCARLHGCRWHQAQGGALVCACPCTHHVHGPDPVCAAGSTAAIYCLTGAPPPAACLVPLPHVPQRSQAHAAGFFGASLLGQEAITHANILQVWAAHRTPLLLALCACRHLRRSSLRGARRAHATWPSSQARSPDAAARPADTPRRALAGRPGGRQAAGRAQHRLLAVHPAGGRALRADRAQGAGRAAAAPARGAPAALAGLAGDRSLLRRRASSTCVPPG